MVARTGTIIKIEVAARRRQIQRAVHIYIGMTLSLAIFDLCSKRCGKG